VLQRREVNALSLFRSPGMENCFRAELMSLRQLMKHLRNGKSSGSEQGLVAGVWRGAQM